MLGWQPYQDGKFRDVIGKALWGEKARDVQVGGQDAGKVDVVIWASVPEGHVSKGIKVDGRPFIRIIEPEDLHDPHDGLSHRFLTKKTFRKVYVLKKGAELKVECAAGEHMDVWPENVSRFTQQEMDTAWRKVEEKIPKSHALVMHFTSQDSAKLILSSASLGLRASLVGQGGGGLSVVWPDPKAGIPNAGPPASAAAGPPAASGEADVRDPYGHSAHQFNQVAADTHSHSLSHSRRAHAQSKLLGRSICACVCVRARACVCVRAPCVCCAHQPLLMCTCTQVYTHPTYVGNVGRAC